MSQLPATAGTYTANLKLVKTSVYTAAGDPNTMINPDCLRVIVGSTIIVDVAAGNVVNSAKSSIKVGVLTDAFQNIDTFYATLYYTIDNSDVINGTELTFTLQQDAKTGFDT